MVKNKMKSVCIQLLFLLCVFSFGESFSQEILFTVMSVKGPVQTKSSAGAWAKVHSGDKLKTGDKIKLGAGDYTGLVHAKGKTIELKSAGEYDVSSLVQNVSKGEASFNVRFASYVANEMVSKDKSKKMTMLGAVVRSMGIPTIEIGIPDAITVIDPQVTFNWYTLKSVKGYVFRLINPSGQTIFMKDTKDTSLTVNIEPMRLNPSLKYSWIVSSDADESLNSDAHALSVLPASKKKAIQDTIAQMKKELPDEKSALNNFLFAKFYESAGLNLNAMQCYENAYTISGGAEDYAAEYGRFLSENNLMNKSNGVFSKITN